MVWACAEEGEGLYQVKDADVGAARQEQVVLTACVTSKHNLM